MVNRRPEVAEIRQFCGFSEAWLCLLISEEGNERGGEEILITPVALRTLIKALLCE